MRKLKLTEKTWYTCTEDTATVYARELASGQVKPAFICNPATIRVIKEGGLNKAFKAGLLRPYSPASE